MYRVFKNHNRLAIFLISKGISFHSLNTFLELTKDIETSAISIPTFFLTQKRTLHSFTTKVVILAGDLNTRTGNANDFNALDSDDDDEDDDDDQPDKFEGNCDDEPNKSHQSKLDVMMATFRTLVRSMQQERLL